MKDPGNRRRAVSGESQTRWFSTSCVTSALVFLLVVVGGTGCQSTRDTTARETMNDASISTAVQMKLTGDREANFARVHVDATQGVVSLNGAVTSSDDKARAERLAKSVNGVSRVRNHLQVQREPAKTGKAE